MYLTMGKLLNEILEIEHPIIVAPMFLVSNVEMVVEACEAGATAAIPALNYRTNEELIQAIKLIKSKTNLYALKSAILSQELQPSEAA